MQSAQPPEQVQAAFDDAAKAGQDRERQKNEGQAYANDVVPKARGAAARLMQEAEGYHAARDRQRRGRASRFRRCSPSTPRRRRSRASACTSTRMQQIYSSTTKVMVDHKGGGNLLYLPLDKLHAAERRRSIDRSASAAAGAAAVAEPPVPAPMTGAALARCAARARAGARR